MSAFLCDSTAFSAIVDVLSYKFNDILEKNRTSRVNSWTTVSAQWLHLEQLAQSGKWTVDSIPYNADEFHLDAAHLYRILIIENLVSLKCRYPHSVHPKVDDLTAYMPNPVVSHAFETGRYGILHRVIRSYEYQSCEHASWDTSLAMHVAQTCKDFIGDKALASVTPKTEHSFDFWGWLKPEDYASLFPDFKLDLDA